MNINKKMFFDALKILKEKDRYGHVDINDLSDQYCLLTHTKVAKEKIRNTIDIMLDDLLDIHTCHFAIQKLQKQNLELNDKMYKSGIYYDQYRKNIIQNCDYIETISNHESINTLINSTSHLPVVCSDLVSEFKRIM